CFAVMYFEVHMFDKNDFYLEKLQNKLGREDGLWQDIDINHESIQFIMRVTSYMVLMFGMISVFLYKKNGRNTRFSISKLCISVVQYRRSGSYIKQNLTHSFLEAAQHGDHQGDGHLQA
ncbi:hypothetical protein ACJX0J_010385, partial [Zea mays]